MITPLKMKMEPKTSPNSKKGRSSSRPPVLGSFKWLIFPGCNVASFKGLKQKAHLVFGEGEGLNLREM